jgi:hypothetical protein
MTIEGSGFDRLEKVLAATAKAIRIGDLTAMAGLAAQTEAALADMAVGEIGPDVTQDRVMALRALAERNAAGLLAAAKGIRAARRRLAEVMAARAGMQTYDNVGNTQNIGGPTGAVKARL